MAHTNTIQTTLDAAPMRSQRAPGQGKRGIMTSPAKLLRYSPFRRREKRPSAPRWMALSCVELADARAARFGNGRVLREAELIIEFMRVGGGAIVHR